MQAKLFKRLFLLILVSYVPSIKAQFLGPARISVQRFEKCGPDGPGVRFDMTVHKINRTHQGIDVYIDTPTDFDETISINGSVSKWGDGGWKPHVLDVLEPYACSFFWKYAKDKLGAILKELGEPEQCPIKKRIFEVKNYIFDGYLSVPVMYGDLMVDVTLDRKGVQLICVKVFIHSEPRKDGGYPQG